MTTAKFIQFIRPNYLELFNFIELFLLFAVNTRVDWGNPHQEEFDFEGRFLLKFQLLFNQGISLSAIIAAQVTSISHSEETIETATRYYTGRQYNDGVNYWPLYDENTG